MSDPLEDRLRTHLADKAARVQAHPDASALMERSVGRSGHRRPMTLGVLTTAVIFAGSGILIGVNLVGGNSTVSPLAVAPSTTIPGRAGASLAPSSSGMSNVPSITVQTPYTFLFIRTTSSGVTIRTYASAIGTAGGCMQSAPCPPVGIVPGPTPCPQGPLCAQPAVIPQAESGATTSGSGSAGGTASSGTAVGTPDTGPTGSGRSGTVGTVPSQPVPQCGQFVIELSTDKAVGSGSVPRPTMAAPSPGTVEVLGVGSFGIAEGAPVGWVAVWAGSGVTSVHLSSGDTVVDAMAPNTGIVVLTAPGNSELAGATVVGVDQSGGTVATAPADQVSGPNGSNACMTLPAKPPTTTTTAPPAPPVTTTTTTTKPRVTTTTAPPTTTTTATPATSVTSPNSR